MNNIEIVRRLREMAMFLEMQDVPFKPRAYEKAAAAVQALDRPLAELHKEGGSKALGGIPGIGKGIAERIAELIETGKCAEHEKLRQATPVDVIGLSGIEGLGPKMIRVLYDKLGIRSLADLEKAAQAGTVRALPRFGQKMEAKILRGIGFLRQQTGRRPLGAVLDLVREIEARLSTVRGVKQVAVAGSIRRRKEMIGDADFLVVSKDPDRVMDAFTSMAEVEHVHAKGTTKGSVRLAIGMDADLRVVSAESFGAALCYFTGSKGHCVALRRIAQNMGLKLNEYGLFRGPVSIAGRTEEEVYEALGLAYIPPELREESGEIEAARSRSLPDLIEYGSLRGDLQTQTQWTDGASSLEDMVAEAQRLGFQYMAITDHTRSLAMTRGSDEKRLLEQMAVIRALDRRSGRSCSGRSSRGPDFRVLAGAEVNISREGELDIADEVLAKLDVVGIAVHSHFDLPRQDQTRRIIRAMENPHADILFHPTGRLLAKREPCDLDVDEVIAAAVRTGTILEIDAYPERLDLKDEHARKAIAAGVKLVIDSDAHHVRHLRYANDFGVGVARRAWATANDVINTRPVDDFLACLKGAAAKALGKPAAPRRSHTAAAKTRAARKSPSRPSRN